MSFVRIPNVGLPHTILLRLPIIHEASFPSVLLYPSPYSVVLIAFGSKLTIPDQMRLTPSTSGLCHSITRKEYGAE